MSTLEAFFLNCGQWVSHGHARLFIVGQPTIGVFSTARVVPG